MASRLRRGAQVHLLLKPQPVICVACTSSLVVPSTRDTPVLGHTCIVLASRILFGSIAPAQWENPEHLKMLMRTGTKVSAALQVGHGQARGGRDAHAVLPNS